MDLNQLHVISVDDDQTNLWLVEALGQRAGLKINSYTDPLAALETVQSQPLDMTFVDYMMPQLNGIEFIKEVKKIHGEIPQLMITARGDNEAIRLEAIEAGATDFLIKPLHAAEFIARATNLAQLRHSQRLLQDQTKLLEHEVSKATQHIQARELESLGVIGRAAEYKDMETANHVRRVAAYSELVAQGLGLSSDAVTILQYAVPLHDIGKIGIPDSILLKPGRLNSQEWQVMRQHTTIGYSILQPCNSQYLQAGAIIAHSHHEKYDGSGYPQGLKGEDIPLYGRIAALADVFDALTTRRPYKEPWSFDRAFATLQADRGSHFDPQVVDTFLAEEKAITSIYERFLDTPEDTTDSP